MEYDKDESGLESKGFFSSLGMKMPEALVRDDGGREVGLGAKLRLGMESETGEEYSTLGAIASRMVPFAARGQRMMANDKTNALEDILDGGAVSDIKAMSPDEFAKAYPELFKADGGTEEEFYERQKNERVLNALNKAGFGGSELTKSPEFQSMSADEKLEALKPQAEAELRRQTATKQKAKEALGAADESGFWGKVVKGGVENTGYTLEYVMGAMLGGGIAVPAMAAAMERQSNLSTNDYEIGKDDELVNKRNAYGEDEAALRGIAGGTLEAGVEAALGKAVGYVGKGALKLIGKMPGGAATIAALGKAGEVAGDAMNKVPGVRALSWLGRQYDKVSALTQMQGWPEELAEEDVQAFVDDVIGLDKKKGEHKGYWNEWENFKRDTMSWNNQRDILVGMLGTMVVQGAYGAARGAAQQRKVDESAEALGGYTSKQAHEARGWLVGHGVSQRDADRLSDAQAAFTANLGKAVWQMSPEERAKLAETHGKRVADIAERVVKQQNFEYGQRLEEAGRSFALDFKRDADGNIAWTDADFADDETGEKKRGRVAVDTKNGVAVRDNGDWTYTIIDRRGNRQTVDGTGGEALALYYAENVAKKGALQDVENETKEEIVKRIIAENYGNPEEGGFIIAGTANEAIDAMAKAGASEADLASARWNLRDAPDGQRSAAAVSGKNTIIVLDNVKNENHAHELVRHEAIGHRSLANRFGGIEGVRKFLKSLDSKNLKDATARAVKNATARNLAQIAANGIAITPEIRKAAEQAAMKEMAEGEGLEEIFAHLVEQRAHNPLIRQRLLHRLREIGRAHGATTPIDDNELEVILGEMERQSAAGNGESNVKVVESLMTPEGFVFLRAEDAGAEPSQPEGAADEYQEAEVGDTEADDFGGFVPYKIYVDSQGRRFQMDGAGQWTTEADDGSGEWVPSGAPDVKPDEQTAKVKTGDPAPKTTTERPAAGKEPAAAAEERPRAKFDSEASYHAKIMTQVDATEEPIDEIEVDNELVPNVKRNADPVTGEVAPIQGDPIDLASNPIVVWETKDGRKVVATGRHRYWLYKRAGRKTIPARVIREADGWTQKDILVLDAMSNIIDKKGTVNDYYEFFKRITPTRAEAREARLLDTEIGRSAFSIYADATADTQGSVNWEEPAEYSEDQIPVEVAAQIAAILPKDANPYHAGAQRAVIDTILKNPKMRGRKVEILARQLAWEAKVKSEHGEGEGKKGEGFIQDDLFGADDSFMKEMAAIAEYRAKKAAGYRYDASVFANTSGRKAKDISLKGGKAAEYGITDAADVKQIKKAYDIAKAKERYWAEGELTPEDDAQMRKDLGLPPKMGAAVEPEKEEPAPEPPKEAEGQGDLFGGGDEKAEPKEEPKVEPKAEPKVEPAPKAEPEKKTTSAPKAKTESKPKKEPAAKVEPEKPKAEPPSAKPPKAPPKPADDIDAEILNFEDVAVEAPEYVLSDAAPSAYDPEKNARNMATAYKVIRLLADKGTKDFRSFVDRIHKVLLTNGREDTWDTLKKSMYAMWNNAFEQLDGTDSAIMDIGRSEAKEIVAEIDALDAEGKPKPREDGRTQWSRTDMANAYRALADAEFARKNPDALKIANEMLAQGVPVSAIAQEYFTREEIGSWKDDKAVWPVSGMVVYTADDAASICEMLSNPYCEIAKALYLDAEHRVIEGRILGIGGLTSTEVSYTELTRDIPRGTAGIILSHNHPSGDVTPSGERSGQQGDMVATSNINRRLLMEHNIPLLDHIVTDTNRFASLRLGSDGYTRFNVAIPAEKWWNRFRGEKELKGGIKRAPMRWENVSRGELPKFMPDANGTIQDDIIRAFAANLSTHNQAHSYIVNLDHHHKLTAIARIPASEAKDSADLAARTKQVMARQGEAEGVILILGSGRFDIKAVAEAAREAEHKIYGIYSIPANKSVVPLDFTKDQVGALERGSVRDIDLFPQPTELAKRVPAALPVEKPEKFQYNTTQQKGGERDVRNSGQDGADGGGSRDQVPANAGVGNAAQGNAGADVPQQGEGGAGGGLLGPNAFGPANGMGGGVGRSVLNRGGRGREGEPDSGGNGTQGSGVQPGGPAQGDGGNPGGPGSQGNGTQGNPVGVQPGGQGRTAGLQHGAAEGDQGAGTESGSVSADAGAEGVYGVITEDVAEALKDNSIRTRTQRNFDALDILDSITFTTPEDLAAGIDPETFIGNPNRPLTDAERKTLLLYTGWVGFERLVSPHVKRALTLYEKKMAENGDSDATVDIDLAVKNAIETANESVYSDEDKVTEDDLYNAVFLKRRFGDDTDKYDEFISKLEEMRREMLWHNSSPGFQTPPALIAAVHRALAQTGLKGGYFLETSAGVGHAMGVGQNFYPTVPKWTAVENDETNAKIISLLYPNALNVYKGDFKRAALPRGFYDYVGFSAPDDLMQMKDEAFVDQRYKPLTRAQFFAAKGLDSLRPGGVMTMIMPLNAMSSKALVRYLTQNGGQITGLFKLVPSLLDSSIKAGEDFVMVAVQKVDGKPKNAKYMSDEALYGESALTEDEFAKGMSDILTGVDSAALADPNYRPGADRQAEIRDERGLVEGSTIAENGKIRIKTGGEMLVATVPGGDRAVKKALEIQKAYEKLRKPVLAYIDHQLHYDLTGDPSPELAAERESMRKAAHDAYFTFTNKYGSLHEEKNREIIELDRADGMRVLAIEDWDKNANGGRGKATPNEMLAKTTIAANPPLPTHADTPEAALEASLSFRGYIDPDYMANILGQGKDELFASLEEKGLVFENPSTRRWEERSLYLSGHVREKIDEAKKAAFVDPKFNRNVEELQKVKTPDIHFVEKNPKAAIQPRAGMGWVPADIQQNFFQSINIRVSRLRYSPSSGKWIVGDVTRQTKYGTEADDTPLDYDRMVKEPKRAPRNAADASRQRKQAKNAQVKKLLVALLNHTPVTVRDDEGEIDEEASHVANAKINAVQTMFSQWILRNNTVKDRLADIYNRRLNDITERDFSGYKLVMAGLNEKWRERMYAPDRSYQPESIARIVHGGNTLLAHEVGSGKTFEMQAATMEMRRTGRIRKAIHVVKKNTFEQYANEWLDAFPGAKLLAIDTEDKRVGNRSDLVSLVQNGDWDGIIVTHETFSAFGLSKQLLAEHRDEVEAEYQQMLQDVREAADPDWQKQYNALASEMNDELAEIDNDIKRAEKQQDIQFDTLGIDQIFLDEAHNFKGLSIKTGKSGIRGISSSPSNKAAKLNSKVQYVNRLRNYDGGVVFATGTPIKNSFGEVFVMGQYLVPEALREMGMQHFDGWCNSYADTIQVFAPNDAGELKEESTIKPVNAIPMSRLFRSFADVVTREGGKLKIKVPKIKGGKPTLHSIPPSRVQDVINQAIVRMLRNEEDGGGAVNALWRKYIGRGSAIDPRTNAINDHEGRRVKECGDEILRIYREHDAEKAAQMVFLDRGVPSDGGKPKVATAKLNGRTTTVSIKNTLSGLRDMGHDSYRIILGGGKWDVTITAPDKTGQREMIAETVHENGQKITEQKTFFAMPESVDDGPFSAVAMHEALVRFQLRLNFVAENFLDSAKQSINRKRDYGVKSILKSVPKLKDGEPVDIEALVNEQVKRLGYDPRFKTVKTVDDVAQPDVKDTIVNEPWELPSEYIYSNVFNMYDALKDYLVRGGIPAEQIAYIHEAKSDEEKEAIFEAVRSGRIRVLIGSTQKMGEGTNIQKRLVALHNMDIQWTPAEMKQRIGRILRSGNEFGEVEIHNYVTIRSMDANSWSIVGVKNRLISQVLNVPRLNIIDAIDGDQVSTEETLAAILNDPRIKYRVQLEQMLNDARLFHDIAQQELDVAEKRLPSTRKEFDMRQKDLLELRKIYMRVAEQRRKENNEFSIVPEGGGERITRNVDVFVAIKDVAEKNEPVHRIGSQSFPLGTVFGSPLEFTWDVWGNGDGSMSASASLEMPEIGLMTSISSPRWGVVSLTEQDITNFKTALSRFLNPVSEKNQTPKKLFEKEQEIRGLAENVAAVEEAIKRAKESADETQNQINYAEPRYAAIMESMERSANGSDESEFIKNLPELMKGDPTKGPDDDPNGGGDGGGDMIFGDTPSDGVRFETPGIAALMGITNAEQDAALTERGMNAPKKRVRGDAKVMQGAEALGSNAEFMRKLEHVIAKSPRSISAEENIAMARDWLKAKDEYDDLVESIVEAENAGDRETVAELRRRMKSAESRMAEIVKAREGGVGEAARTLRTNRFLFDKDYSYAGLVAKRMADLGRPLTDAEFKELKDIADALKKLDEKERDIILAKIKAFADKAIRDFIEQAKEEQSKEPRGGNEVRRMLKKRAEALAQIEVLAYELGGSLDSLIPTGDAEDFASGSQFANMRKWLRNLAEYHIFHNPDIGEAELVQLLMDDIAPWFTADMHTVRSIFSGYGHSWKIDRTEEQRKVSDLMSQSRILEQILSLENNELPKLTGPQRSESSDAARELMRLRDMLRRQKEREGLLPTTNNHLKTALESAKTRYEHMIADIKAALESGEKLPKKQPLGVTDDELEALKAEYRQLRDEYDRIWGKGQLTDEQKRQIAIGGLQRTLDRWAERLARAQAGDFTKPGARARMGGEEIEALRRRIAEAKDAWTALKAAAHPNGTPEEIADLIRRRMDAITRAIQHWQTAMITGDIGPKPKKEIPWPDEKSRRDYEFAVEQRKRLYRKILDMREHDENMKKPYGLGYAKEYASFVSNAMRSLLATADFSAMMRQTSALTTAHLPTALKTLAATMKTFRSPAEAGRIDAELKANPIVREALDNGWLEWRDLEETGSSHDVEMFHGVDSSAITIGKNEDGTERRVSLGDIPVLGKLLHGSERQYASFINMMSAEVYTKLVQSPVWGRQGPSDKQKRDLAAYVNMANGSAQLGAKGKQAMNTLTAIFWAPKLAVSRLQLATGMGVVRPFFEGEKGEATAKERAKSAAVIALEQARAFLGAAAAGWLLMALFGDDDDKYEMEQADAIDKALIAMKPRIGSTSIDMSGGVTQWWKLLRMIATGTKRTSTGREIDLKNTYGRSLTQEIFRFAQGKFNPLISNTLALIEGKDYVGKEFSAWKLVKNAAIPLAAQDIWEAAFNENNGLGRGLLMAPFILTGAGGTTFDVDRFAVARNEFAARQKEYRAALKGSDYDKMKELLQQFPELKQASRLEALFESAKKAEAMINKRRKRGLAENPVLEDLLKRRQEAALAEFRRLR